MSLTAAGVENKRENLLPNILESVYIYIYLPHKKYKLPIFEKHLHNNLQNTKSMGFL